MSLLGFSRGSRRRGLASITGPVLRPADAGYAAEIAAFNTAVTRRPGIVVGAQSEDDVVAAVAGAGADGLPVGVKGAGHGGTADPAAPVLLSTRRLDAVTVDPRARTARVGVGRHLGAGPRRGRPARPDRAHPLLDAGRGGRLHARAAAWACSGAGTASPRTTCAACAWSPPTGARTRSTPTAPRSCTGRCAARAAPGSASSPSWSSRCSR